MAVSGAAVAQSTVTISGVLDFAGVKVGGSQAGSKGTTVQTTGGTSATSVLRFIAVEDLGGGMKATAQYNFDPRTLANDSLGNTLNSATAPTANTTTGLSRDEMFVGLSGGFGNLRLGSPNSIGLTTFLSGSPLGTGIGSGYTGNGVSGSMTMTYSTVRYSRSMRYDSPTMNGFTASVLYAPGNDEVANGTTALRIPNNRETTEIGLRYAAGPLTVAYANIAQAAQTNKTGYYSGTQTLAAKTAANVLTASYNLGATTVFAGMNNGDRSAADFNGAAVDSKGSSIGISHNIGAVGLMASYRTQKAAAHAASASTTTAAAESKITGLRADYNLSKTAAVYVGYEKWDNGTAAANETTMASVGLRKSF